MKLVRLLLLLTILSLGTVSAASFFHPAPAASSGKYFDHVVTILMENNDLPSVLSQGTFQASLASQYTLSAGYSGTSHPSEPNYIALLGGSINGINNDGICCYVVNAPDIVDRLQAAGLTWKAFAEDASGSGTCSFSPPRGGDHFPFLDYADMNTAARCANFASTSSSSDTEFVSYLNTAGAANYVWLTPNDNDNSHDTPIATGDAYLAALVPQILASTTFTTTRSALFIVYDEGNDVSCTSGGSDCIYASWSGPTTKQGFTSSNSYNHYSYVHTILDNWGLPTIANDAGAPVMAEFFAGSGTSPLTTGFTISPPTGQVGQTMTFTAGPSGGTSPYTNTWNFGDGSSGAGATTTHAYSTTGTFHVTLTTQDSASPANTATSTKVLAINSAPLSGSLSISFSTHPSNPSHGQTVTFVASVTGGSPPYGVGWDFGDGGISVGLSTTHVFSNPGTFNVTAAVTDSGSPAHTTATSTLVSVTSGTSPPPTGLTISISSNPANPTAGQTVAFTATVTAGTPPYGVGWDFGDGGISVGLSTIHVFSTSGTFNVTAAVTDSASPSQNAATSIFVVVNQGTSPPPGLKVQFTVSRANPAVGDSISFKSSVSGGTPPYSYAWNFGDSAGTDTLDNPTYRYSSAGTFTAGVTVTDSGGATATFSQDITVAATTPPPPSSGGTSGQYCSPLTTGPAGDLEPQVSVDYVNPGTSADFATTALFDTGATYSLAPSSLATSLGLTLTAGTPVTLTGVGGTLIQAYVFHLTLSFGGTLQVVNVPVAFTDSTNQFLIGRLGFLDQVGASFDPSGQTVCFTTGSPGSSSPPCSTGDQSTCGGTGDGDGDGDDSGSGEDFLGLYTAPSGGAVSGLPVLFTLVPLVGLAAVVSTAIVRVSREMRSRKINGRGP